MKTRLQITKLALLGGLFTSAAAHAAGAGNSACCTTAAGCCASKRAPAEECCVTHDACKGKACCTTGREFYSVAGDKGGIRWRVVRECTAACPLPHTEKRAVCGKGKSI